MYAESNKAVCRRFIQKIFNEGELALIRDFVSADAVSHESADSMSGRAPFRGKGIEGMVDLVSLYRSAFSDFHLEIKDQISEGDRVVTFVRLRGTVDVTGIRVDRFSNGKIAESWFHLDALGERLLHGDCVVDCEHCDGQVLKPASFGGSDTFFTARHHGNGYGLMMQEAYS